MAMAEAIAGNRDNRDRDNSDIQNDAGHSIQQSGSNHGGFHRANCRYQQMMQQRWCQGQRKRQILRSQIGFAQATPSRPAPCVGCHHYHGQAYGWSRADRTRLICGFHPYGWDHPAPCPDWTAPPTLDA